MIFIYAYKPHLSYPMYSHYYICHLTLHNWTPASAFITYNTLLAYHHLQYYHLTPHISELTCFFTHNALLICHIFNFSVILMSSPIPYHLTCHTSQLDNKNVFLALNTLLAYHLLQ